ncbi:hypothetical protein [uncultured Cohaesibacter sp.]|uniref:hypothetical protein n=1 Tax=uncultured Cohaesibacter sp. TaxID=1002546 RepID=UPI0029C84AFA|nr:hypothetical protein [uncultured Cohaesibacter sp.]
MTAFFWQALGLIIVAVLIGMLLGYVIRQATRSKPAERETVKPTAYKPHVAATPTPAVAAGASTAAFAQDQEAAALALAKETNEALKAETDAQDASEDTGSTTGESPDMDVAALKVGAETEERSEAVLKAASAAKAALEAEGDAVDKDAFMARVDASADVDLSKLSEGAEVDPDAEEARIAAALLTVPKDATDEQKANAVGKKPKLLKKARKAGADDLKRIKGVGKVLEGKLNDLGIYHFDQIANWTRDEVAWVTTFLNFKGRIDREKWIPQAKGLLSAEGATAASEEKPSKSAKPVETAKPSKSKKPEAPAKKPEAPAKKEEPVAKAAPAPADKADAEEEKIAAAIAALPKDATAEDKANVAGKKPRTMKQPRKAGADDLKRIKGVGKVLEGKLNDLGIYHYDQIAKWNRSHINWVSTFLSFKGRIDREDWIEQAKLLASGEETEFSKRVDKGEVDSSKG